MNSQPVEGRVDGVMLDVVKVWRTIQGEGPYTGRPAVFVRLAGCNLKCSFCDTDYTSGREMLTVTEVMERIEDVASRRDLVVLTGGEPFRQDVEPLIDLLRKHTSHDIQVETNGTIYRENLPYHAICVVCSPKTKKVAGELVPYIQAWKYVVKVGDLAEDGLPKNLARPAGPGEVYVQPMDEGDSAKNHMNLKAAVDVCLRHGYRLSLQVHKIVGVE